MKLRAIPSKVRSPSQRTCSLRQGAQCESAACHLRWRMSIWCRASNLSASLASNKNIYLGISVTRLPFGVSIDAESASRRICVDNTYFLSRRYLSALNVPRLLSRVMMRFPSCSPISLSYLCSQVTAPVLRPRYRGPGKCTSRNAEGHCGSELICAPGF